MKILRGKEKSLLFVFLLPLFFMVSCSSSGSSGNDSGNGVLSLSLTDASTTDYQAAYITIKEVKVLTGGECENTGDDEDSGATEDTSGTETETVAGVETETDETSEDCEGEWIVVATPNKTYNLLELVNGLLETLGTTEIPAGEYDQMRLVLGTTPDDGINTLGETHPYANYIIDSHSNVYELKIPSGCESGFKIIGQFTVAEDGTTDIILDFNVLKSIVQAGKGGKWLVKPTVKLLDEKTLVEVVGKVTNSEDGAALEGVLVSAQKVEDEVTTQSVKDDSGMEIVVCSTVSDETGGYTLMLHPGTYQIVAKQIGYLTQTSEVVVQSGETSTVDFALVAGVGEGTITGMIMIDDGEDEQFVTVSVRETTTAEDGTETIVEVASASVANGGQYNFDLPSGTYSLVAMFTINDVEMTLESEENFVLADGDVIQFDIIFGNQNNDDSECDEGTEGCRYEHKVTVCHRGRSINISRSALNAHLNHGSVEGECEEGALEEAEDDDTAVSEDDGKVTICHKGREMRVSEASLEKFLNRGDVEGSCSEDSSSDDGSASTDDGNDDDASGSGKDKEKDKTTGNDKEK